MIFKRRRRSKGSGPAGLGEGFVQVGSTAQLRGRLEGQGLVLIHGRLTGELSLSGELIVAADGETTSLNGAADALRVEGKAEGRLVIHGVATVAAGGILTGELDARKLDASPDATVSASLRIVP